MERCAAGPHYISSLDLGNGPRQWLRWMLSQDIVRKILCRARMPLEQKRKRMEDFGCNMADAQLELQSVTEEEVVQQLVVALASCSPVKQHKVGPYRVDLYLAGPKVAIECDENGHRHYNNEREQHRQSFIEQELGCSFVRFDPYSKDFNVMTVLAEIIAKLRRF